MNEISYTGVYESPKGSGNYNARIIKSGIDCHLGREAGKGDSPLVRAANAAHLYDAAVLVLGRTSRNFPDETISLGRQQTALKTLIIKGLIEVPDLAMAMEHLAKEQLFIHKQILAILIRGEDANEND